MKEIKITEKDGIQTVNARELWEELESKRKYADWIKDKIESNFFTQNIDYTVFHNFVKDDTAFGGKRKAIDYFISIDMAKELCMLENTEKGREVRKYFIECERRLKETNKPMSIEEMTKTVLKYYEEKTKELESKIEEDKPKVEFFDKFSNAEGLATIQQISKVLNMGSNSLFSLLRDKKILFRDSDGINLPMQKFLTAGYFVVKENTFKRGEEEHSYKRVYATPKGETWLIKKVEEMFKEEE